MSVAAFSPRPAERTAESLSDRIRRLRAEAEGAARDHAEILVRAIAEVEAIAADIADGGEAYAPGIRETARRLSPDLETARLNIEALLGR
jgi:hypothetical protein